MTASFSFF